MDINNKDDLARISLFLEELSQLCKKHQMYVTAYGEYDYGFVVREFDEENAISGYNFSHYIIDEWRVKCSEPDAEITIQFK